MKIRFLTASGVSVPKEMLVALAYNGKNPDLGKPYEAFVKKAKGTGDLKTSYRGTSRFYPEGSKTTKRVAFVGMG